MRTARRTSIKLKKGLATLRLYWEEQELHFRIISTIIMSNGIPSRDRSLNFPYLILRRTQKSGYNLLQILDILIL